MGYVPYYVAPLSCILIPLLTLAATVWICRVTARLKPGLYLWSVLLGLGVVGYVTHVAWRMWHFFWNYCC